MKAPKDELRDLVKLPPDAFRRLWADWEATVADFKLHGISDRIPITNKHPPGYQKRFERLRAALSGLNAADRKALWRETVPPATPPDGDPAWRWLTADLVADPLAFTAMLEAVRVASKTLSKASLNRRGAATTIDLPMRAAVGLWRDHVKRRIGINKEGPFAKFAKLFFSAIGYKAESLSRRIRANVTLNPSK